MPYYSEILAKEISVEAAIFFRCLLDLSLKYEEYVQFDGYIWMTLSQKDAYESTGITRKIQRRAIRQLVENGLIRYCMKFQRRQFSLIGM